MLIKTDAQKMAICYNELLRLRDKYILGDLDRSNAFNLFSELVGYYHDKRSFVMLGHIIQSKNWDINEINDYKKRPNALIFEKCNWQDVALRALAYIDKHLTPVMEEYGTGYACKNWAPLMNGFNGFLLELLTKMMFKESDAIYYHCLDQYCFCVDTSRALKPLRFVRR